MRHLKKRNKILYSFLFFERTDVLYFYILSPQCHDDGIDINYQYHTYQIFNGCILTVSVTEYIIYYYTYSVGYVFIILLLSFTPYLVSIFIWLLINLLNIPGTHPLRLQFSLHTVKTFEMGCQ